MLTLPFFLSNIADKKHWPTIKNPEKYKGQRVVIGSVTDSYNPQEEQLKNTRKLLEQMKDSGAENYIGKKYPRLMLLYDAIYIKKDRNYVKELEEKAEKLTRKNSCLFVDNKLPYVRVEKDHPTIVNYFYHEEIRGSENTGRRTR